MLREVIVKIGLEMTDTQEGVIVEILLDSKVIELVMSSEFARKQWSKLKDQYIIWGIWVAFSTRDLLSIQ